MQTLAKLRVRYTIVIENDLDRASGWGNKEEDWVKHFTKHLQESNTHYCPEVLEIKTRVADNCWQFNEESIKLVGIGEFNSCN